MAFIAGTLFLYRLPALPSLGSLLLLWVAPFVLLIIPRLRRFAWLALLFSLGFSLAALDGWQRLTPSLPEALEKTPLVVHGVVDSLPRREGRILRFELQLERAMDLRGEAVRLPERLRLSWYNDGPESLAPGQRWRLRVKLKRPHGMQNPGGFDYEKWLFQRGIGATGYVRSRGDNRLLTPAGGTAPVMQLRHHLKGAIAQALPEHPMRGLVTALAIGERGEISDRQWQVLIASGTNHLVAISGLHVGLVAGMGFMLMRSLWRWCPACAQRLPAPRAAALLAMLLALAYAALAGFSLPTQRALVMLSVVLGAVWLQRPLRKGRVLLLALWAVVLLDPVSVLSAGFWLSFGAVTVILYGMTGRLAGDTFWWRWGRVQWIASFGLMPLLLLFFQQGSLNAPLANMVAVPWVSLLVVPLTLLGTALVSVLPTLGAPLLGLAATLLGWLWPLLEWLNALLPVLPRGITLGLLPVALLGVAWLFAPHGWPLRWAGVVLLLPLLLWRPSPPEPGSARVTLLDVGQGLAAVVQTHEHLLLFDTGPRYPSGFNTGDAVVVPFLRAAGVERVDTLVISHSGNDHAGGVPAVVEQLEVGRIVSAMARRDGWPAVTPCSAGMRWRYDGVLFEMLHPARAGLAPEKNDNSCVLRVSAGGRRLLLTADIEAAAERALLQQPQSLAADILVAPHHGSTSSSSAAFVEAVGAEAVLFSVGYRNRYGFPHAEVVERYRQQGAELLRTDEDGAISFLLGNDAPQLQRYRWQNRRIWR
ncbi:MAG: DNA internalization-related competence protein ComEC/Rec2 [Pseudomonadota bacterium]